MVEFNVFKKNIPKMKRSHLWNGSQFTSQTVHFYSHHSCLIEIRFYFQNSYKIKIVFTHLISHMHNLLIFKSKHNFSKNFFFLLKLLSLNGVNKILPFIVLNVFLHLRNIFFRLSDQMLILCVIVITLKEF